MDTSHGEAKKHDAFLAFLMTHDAEVDRTTVSSQQFLPLHSFIATFQETTRSQGKKRPCYFCLTSVYLGPLGKVKDLLFGQFVCRPSSVGETYISILVILKCRRDSCSPWGMMGMSTDQIAEVFTMDAAEVVKILEQVEKSTAKDLSMGNGIWWWDERVWYIIIKNIGCAYCDILWQIMIDHNRFSLW